MRLLSRFDQPAQAQAFAQVLHGESIEAAVRDEADGSSAIWVLDEGQMGAAQALLDEFRSRPDAPRFTQARKAAAERVRAEQAEAKASRHRTIRMQERWQRGRVGGVGAVSLGLIVASVGVAILTNLGDRLEVVRWFTIVGFEAEGGYVQWHGWSDLLGGEVWRLITPIFIHFGFFHLLFNGWWVKDLGTAIERGQSSFFLLLLVLLSGVGSNLLQFVVGASPMFGGLSGVVYALFGYIAVRARRDPESGYVMPRQTVMWLMGWFVLCFTGLMGPVANGAHAGGLIIGAGLGLLWSVMHRMRLRG